MLADSLLEIADDMEKEAADLESDASAVYVVRTLKSYAKQIRRAVKAAEGSSPQILPGFFPNGQPVLPAEAQHRLAIEAAKAEFKGKVHRIGDMEDSMEGTMVKIVGGTDDGDMINISNDVPHGAKVPLTDKVYIFNQTEKTLVYSESETNKLRNRIKEEKAAKESKIALG